MSIRKAVPVPAATGGRMIQLDVLRGIAILLVLNRHPVITWPYAGPLLMRIMHCLYNLGWTGVDLFFVLSGFLIGGLLFSEIKKTNTLNVKRFLIRRGFKIWPAYMVFIAYVFCFTVYETSLPKACRLIWPNVLHLQNYFGSVRGHTWSLAVEEHFYLLLPLFLLFVIRRRRADGSMPAIPIAAIVLMVVCTGLRYLINPHREMKWEQVIAATHTRIDGLFFGVMLAYFYHLYPQKLARVARHRALLILLGLALISPMAFIDQGDTPFVWTIGVTMLYLGYGCILMAFVHAKPGEGWLGKAVTSPVARVIAWIGVFSYSIYLWQMDIAHRPLTWLLQRLIGGPITNQPIRFRHESLVWLVFTLGFWTAAILGGVVMAKLIEMPVLTLRERLFPREDRPVPKPAPAEMTEARAPALLMPETSSASSI
jgi:peptidoglycan/LPS O-acetylase OafA/YrhL